MVGGADEVEPAPRPPEPPSPRHEIPMYIQRSSLQFDDIINFFTNVEAVRFNYSKPSALNISDDCWAAIKLRVDPLARLILNPQRYFAASAGVAFLILVVFYAVKPKYDRKRIHAEDRPQTDDDQYDDYIFDDLYLRDHSTDDVVAAKLNYLNEALEEGPEVLVWRTGLIVSLAILFGAVIFIAVQMEKRNQEVDKHIRQAIDEIRPRIETEEGVGIEYRTKTGGGICGSWSKNMCPARVVVFRRLTTSDGRCVSPRRRRSFFSEDYQRTYFPPVSPVPSPPQSSQSSVIV